MRLFPALFALALLLGWSLPRAAGADYTVSTSGNAITVTNTSNHADTLTVSQQSSNTISFAAAGLQNAGRTFSVNGGSPISGNSGNVSLSNVTSITINGGAGGETFNIGGFGGSSFPSLTINGGVGSDTVNFQGNITFATDLNVNLQTSSGSSDGDAINVTGAQLVCGGTVDLECNQSISITGGATVQTAEGDLTLMANQQATARTGNFTGVNIDSSTVSATEAGDVTVNGKGGNGSGGYQLGVNISSGAQLSANYGSLNVTGAGGASTSLVNRGVTVIGTGSAITAGRDGIITVTGTAGTQGTGYGIGVSVISGGEIGGSLIENTVIVTGTGGGSGGSNQGVEIGGSGSVITGVGDIRLTGTAGQGTSSGLYMDTSGAVTIPPGSGSGIYIFSDSISLDSTASLNATSASNSVQIDTIAAPHINLGGADAAGTLGLSAAELGQIKSPSITIQGLANGDMTISAPIAFSSATSLGLYPGSGGLNATASGTDLNLDGGTLYLGGVNMPITGPSADTSFPQLNVIGSLVLGQGTSALLNLAGTTYAGMLGQQFTIIKNNGGQAISGTFQNLPEGAYLPWPGSAAFAAQISYLGGTGHDAVLTLVPVAQALNVTSTADDGSPGSLPAVIAFAAANPGADTITFASSLNGQTIPLSGTINIADTAALTIDASKLTGGLTLQGGGASGNFGLFSVSNSQSNLTLRGLTLAGGGGSAFTSGGGAIFSKGTLTAIGCTFTGNSAPVANGGAIASFGGSVTVLECTFSGNSAEYGGAIYSASPLTVAQSTISKNSALAANGSGGGILTSIPELSVTLTDDIIAGNSASHDPDLQIPASPTRSGANVIGDNSSVGGAFPPGLPNANGDYVGTTASPLNPLLATLGSYGGPTQTLPPLPGSPAIDHGVNAAIPLDPATGLAFTVDQRGKTRISNSTVDIGAVETSALVVTTAADDGSSGSLRQVVNQATDITTTLTFTSGLSGSTIPLGTIGAGIALDTNIAIDASALAGGITISGGGASGNFRLFFVPANTTVALRNLTLTGGGGSNFSGQGGAIINSGAVTASQCVFSGNSIAANSGNGGSIYNASTGSMTLNQCNFVANSVSGSAAGGAISNDGSMALNDSTLSGNSAPSGGAILNNGTLSLTQCTLAGNTASGSSPAGQGGAIYSGAGTIGITQCTLSRNSGTDGGGIYNAGGTLTLTNGIAGGNTASLGADMDNHATLVISGANIVQVYAGAAATGSGTINQVAPLLAPLGNYGGPTETMALLMNSPARNAAVGSAFTADQRGFAIADGKPDIGAYEAGDITNYNAWIYENLPASTSGNAAVHAASYDYDGDGVSNYNEWLAQTNPADSTSYLHITQATLSGKTLTIVFPNVAGRSYTVQSSTDLKNWTTLSGSLSGPSGAATFTYTFTTVPPRFFLRASVGAP